MRSVVRFDPFNELNEVFDRLLQGVNTAPTTVRLAIPLDVMEDSEHFIVRASIPGIAPNEIDVKVENGVLTLSGEHREVKTTDGTRVYHREITYGSFTRSIRLPENLDLGSVEATHQDGVLTVTFKKPVEVKPEPIRIEVKAITPEN